MTHGHRYYITINRVFISTNLERHLNHVLYLDGAGVTQPLDMVWVWMLHVLQVEFLTKLLARKVVATSTIDDDLDGSPIDARSCVKQVASLVFFNMDIGGQSSCHNQGRALVAITKYLIGVYLHILHRGNFGIVLIFTHRLILAVVVDDHDLLVGALKGLVPLSSALVALQESCAGRRSLRCITRGRRLLDELRCSSGGCRSSCRAFS